MYCSYLVQEMDGRVLIAGVRVARLVDDKLAT
jgi:hypothetical protein